VSLDLVIKNGKVVDGSGNAWFEADIGIRSGKIVQIGTNLDSDHTNTVIDATGLMVSPGFIDIHGHDDYMPFFDPFNKPKLLQGVTTVVSGNCGSSPFPVKSATASILKKYVSIPVDGFEVDWCTFEQFAQKLSSIELGTNLAYWVGHGSIRIAVMGMENREPTMAELELMKDLLAQCLIDGAYGLSTGLIYPPGVFSTIREIVELGKVLAKYGGIYVTHMRDESDRILEAMDEALRVGKEAGIPVHISHHKVSGVRNWGRSEETLRKIEQAREDGLDITADAYPYTAGNASLVTLLPPWVHSGGEEKIIERVKSKEQRAEIRRFIEGRNDWENWIRQIQGWDSILISYAKNKELQGKTLLDIAEGLSKDPFDTLFDIVAEEGVQTSMIIFSMDEHDVDNIICHPYVSIGTDGSPDTGANLPHPREYATFPRVLRKYARERRLITVEEAVRKMTSLPAQRCGFTSKGLLREGFDADITIFNSKTIADEATYQNPQRGVKGIEYVIIDGTLAVAQGKLTGAKAGKLLLRGR
jgi:N-acyl-D-amino-acid deacylase